MIYPLLDEIMLFVMWCVEFCNLKLTLNIYISKIVRLEFMFLWSEKRIYLMFKSLVHVLSRALHNISTC